MFEIIIYAVMAVLGLFLLVGAIKQFGHVSKAKSYTGRVEGQIIEVKVQSSVSQGRKYYYYTPVYQYMVNGQMYSGEVEIRTSNNNKYHEGDRAELRYNTANPSEFHPEGGSGNMIGNALLFLLGGGVFIGVCVYQILKMLQLL